MTEQYFGGNQNKKRMTKREIEEMKKNMKKVDTVHTKADNFHKIEEKNLDQLLKKLNQV
ncbi:hypothetical protein AGMMS50249_4150 [candidate division SR1 bacterium]|nr:hypothetical protein AGMMS50249_4150 [candidate division SR1 bacterium]